jgi:hypothetical protein
MRIIPSSGAAAMTSPTSLILTMFLSASGRTAAPLSSSGYSPVGGRWEHARATLAGGQSEFGLRFDAFLTRS